MSYVPVAVDLPAQLASVREQLDEMTARYRQTMTKLADTRGREQTLRQQLEDAQRALRELVGLFTDDGMGALWVRTPYIPAENLAESRRVMDRKPPGPGGAETRGSL